MAYSKPWLSVDQQLELLRQRGLLIDDYAKAYACLGRIGYYRLSGYLYAFRVRSDVCCPYPRHATTRRTERLVLDEYKAGSTFRDCMTLYIFDKKLRVLMLDALERVEIALRVDIAHLLGKRNTFAYLYPEEFHPSFSQEISLRTGMTKQHEWLRKQADLIIRSGEEFVSHNKRKTGLPLAIWIACEVWDFGATTKIFGGLKEEDQDCISQKYCIRNGRIFASWLETLNYLRNVCAHHSRLWNRNMERQPKLPDQREVVWVNSFVSNPHALARCFLQILMLAHLIKKLNPNSSWPMRVIGHIKTFPQLDHVGLNLAGMGAPVQWRELLKK